jgi:hypothetical protein
VLYFCFRGEICRCYEGMGGRGSLECVSIDHAARDL